jgi:hypothetical protein
VRLTEDRGLSRRRLAVLFRLPLALPPLLALLAWTAVAIVAVLVAWLAALARGRVPVRLHRYLVAALEYAAQATAWMTLVSGTYPWPRRRSAHPVRLEISRGAQPRWTVLLRAPVAVPAFVLGSALAVVLGSSSMAAWFVALALGRTTEGLRELGAFCLRYIVETLAYLFLLTPHRPRLGVDQPLADPHAAQ